jgi:hypothetical protein
VSRAIKIKIGDVYGRLTVVERAENAPNKKTRWRCVCECGNEVVVISTNLTRPTNPTLSCGCYHKEQTSKTKTTHGMCHTREYGIWFGMKRRCNDQKKATYKRYGGRGITYDPRWEDFALFIEDMGFCPTEDGTLDRIDNDGNYEKDNCRWTTSLVQGRNKSDNRRITYNGDTHCVSEWAEILGISRNILSARLNKLGWSEERALATPANAHLTNQET